MSKEAVPPTLGRALRVGGTAVLTLVGGLVEAGRGLSAHPTSWGDLGIAIALGLLTYGLGKFAVHQYDGSKANNPPSNPPTRRNLPFV